MKPKPITARAQANHDIDEAIGYHVGEAAEQAALGFIDAVEDAYAHIARNPATGSLRYAYALNLPALRYRPLTRFPYLVIYIERTDHIDVWRVLHGKRDIPTWMTE